MSKILKLVLPCVLFVPVLVGCGGSSSNPKNTNVASSAAKGSTQVEERESAPKVLTEENATSFLQKYGTNHSENVVTLNTPKGDIKIRLYKDTPLHRANFIYLTNKGYFDDTWFYRVSKDHVIQAGNTDGMETIKKRKKIGEYKIPAEMGLGHFHKYGAVAMARSYYQNPEKLSDPYEFYIILGKSYTRRELELLAEKHEMTFSEAQLDFYSNTKGSPHLDGEHTVFGEVIEGMDVVEAINNVEVDDGEWPLINLPIKAEIVQ